jgi:hypothetical protein
MKELQNKGYDRKVFEDNAKKAGSSFFMYMYNSSMI